MNQRDNTYTYSQKKKKKINNTRGYIVHISHLIVWITSLTLIVDVFILVTYYMSKYRGHDLFRNYKCTRNMYAYCVSIKY